MNAPRPIRSNRRKYDVWMLLLLAMGILMTLALRSEQQTSDSERVTVQSPATYNATISRDAELRFSTYLGGSNIEASAAIAIGSTGFVYVTGITTSDDFPTVNPLFPFKGGLLLGSDIYVAKLNSDGTAVEFATYLGGSRDELVADLVVDDDGAVYVVGGTASGDFPTRNALHGYQGGSLLRADGFVARFSANGTSLEFATYLGGSGDESITTIALGPNGALFVAGSTVSNDFPTTPGAFQNTRPDPSLQQSDIFLVKLRPTGNDSYVIDYSTYLGGNGADIPTGIAIDGDGRAWVTGFTNSTDFPMQGALQDTYAGPIRDLEGDMFIARLNEDGTALDFSTYLGGNQNDQGTSLTLDEDGNVYVAGWTESNDFPTTPGAYETDRQGIRDAFVLKLIPTGNNAWTLDYSTRLAGTGHEMGRMGLAVDKAGRVWISGATTSEQFPTIDPVQVNYGGGVTDAFLARLDASGSVLGYSTFLGGTGADVVTGLALGETSACITGSTSSTNFPVQGAIQPMFDGPPAAGLNVTSTFVSCFEARNEASVLTRMAVTPDSVGLIAGETQPFAANGFDQFDQLVFTIPGWSATGGTIEQSGLYTAGDNAGLFTATATATDAATGIEATAIVNIFSGVGIEDEADVPTEFALYGNYPNPFNPETMIRFDVKEPARVVLTLYDALGRKQVTLVETDLAPGRHEVRFDARAWPSGIYFFAIEMGDFRDVKKMVLVR